MRPVWLYIPTALLTLLICVLVHGTISGDHIAGMLLGMALIEVFGLYGLYRDHP